MDSKKVASYFAQLRKVTHKIDSVILEIQRKGNGLEERQPFSTIENLLKEMDKFKIDVEDSQRRTKDFNDQLERVIHSCERHLSTHQSLLDEAYEKVKIYVVEEPDCTSTASSSDDASASKEHAVNSPQPELQPSTPDLQNHQPLTEIQANSVVAPENQSDEPLEVVKTPCLLDFYTLQHQLKILDQPNTHITKSGGKLASNSAFKHAAAKRDYSEKKSKRGLSLDPSTPVASANESSINISPMTTPSLHLPTMVKKTPLKPDVNPSYLSKYQDRIAPVQVEEYFLYSKHIKAILSRKQINSVIESINTMFATMDWKAVREDELKELIRAELGPVTNILLIVLKKRPCRIKADADQRGYVVPVYGVPTELPVTTAKK